MAVTPTSPEKLSEAIQLYESSDRGYQPIAREMGISATLMRRELVARGTFRDQRTANIAARVRGETTRMAQRALPEQAICDAYLAGASENGLSKEHGVTRDVIRRILLRFGVERRSVTGANQLMMSKRTPEENMRNAQAAHDAIRGVRYTAAQVLAGTARGAYVPTAEQMCERAQRREGTVTTFATELLYAAWLRLRGVEFIQQKAIGPYNCDIAAGQVAIEIFGGNWHGGGYHAEMFAERAQYIIDQGWLLVIVWVDQSHQRLTEASADYLAVLIEEANRDPSLRGQLRMVWGDGQEVPTGDRELREFAAVPTHVRRKKVTPSEALPATA